MSLKVCFFGDSICVGQRINLADTWVHKISLYLSKHFPGSSVFNASVNGNTTRMALERMHFDVLSQKMDILYIQFGMNDCNIWATDFGCPRVSLKAYLANLDEMIERSQRAGIKKIIVNSNHPSSLRFATLPDTQATYEEQNKYYYNCLKNHSKNFPKEILFLDIRNEIENSKKINVPESYLLEDGIHLNEQGHQLYYDYIYPFIAQEVEYYSQSLEKMAVP